MTQSNTNAPTVSELRITTDEWVRRFSAAKLTASDLRMLAIIGGMGAIFTGTWELIYDGNAAHPERYRDGCSDRFYRRVMRLCETGLIYLSNHGYAFTTYNDHR